MSAPETTVNRFWGFALCLCLVFGPFTSAVPLSLLTSRSRDKKRQQVNNTDAEIVKKLSLQLKTLMGFGWFWDVEACSFLLFLVGHSHVFLIFFSNRSPGLVPSHPGLQHCFVLWDRAHHREQSEDAICLL